MKHDLFSMRFLLVPFPPSDYRQPFNVLDSEIRFSLMSFLLMFESVEIP